MIADDKLQDVPTSVPAAQPVAVPGRPPAGTRNRMRLGEALVEAGVLTPAQLQSCLTEQAQLGGPGERPRLGDIILRRKLATEADIARGLALMFGFDFVDLRELELGAHVVRALPRHVATRLRAVPIAAGATWLRIAVADPTDRATLELLRQASGVPTIALVVAAPDAIDEVLDRSWARYGDGPIPVPDLDAGGGAPVPHEAAPPTPDRAVAPSRADGARPPRPATGGWEYAMVGDGMPMEHPGYTSNVDVLEERLAQLGAEGWEAVGVHGNGTRMRVLLKRALG